MNDSLPNSFFLKLDINSQMQKSRSFSKDLFSQKLCQATLFSSTLNKRHLPSIKNHRFKNNNISSLSKNNTNILLSTDKDDSLSSILNKLNIPFLPQKNSFWSVENNKQTIMKNRTILSDFSTKTRYNKKEIKEMMNLKQKFEKNETKENLDKKEVFKNKFMEIISHINIQKNSIKKENSKEILGYEYKLSDNKNINSKNNSIIINKYKNKSQEKTNKISIYAISNNTNKKDNDSIIFMKSFYESFIELYEHYDDDNYISCINKFNQNYFFLFDLKSFPKTSMNVKFLDIFKYSSILIVCLVFLSKDENLYKNNILKIKEFLESFILLSINSIDYKILESKKIEDFVEQRKTLIEGKTLIEALNQIISLLFDNKMNDYKKLRKCLKQLSNNINDETPERILTIVNDIILFCHNCSYFIEETPSNKKEKKKKVPKEKNDDKSSNKTIKTPFIKNKMEKKFCLVIDLDETLIHNLNLPFGDYFFVRPGFFTFLEKIQEIFEIIVFTAGHKHYAYSIIDKIDYKNYISYILYKKHIIYEDGVPVKKLDLIGRDLNKVIYVDNLEKNAKYNKKNFYMISSWYNNIYDTQLDILKDKLINIATCGKYDDDITKGLIDN